MTRCRRLTPRRISARVAAIGTPEDSRGTASMQPSTIGASASSSVRTIAVMTAGYSLSPFTGRGNSLRQRRLHVIRRERRAADAHAGGVEHGVGDRSRHRPARRLAGARRRDLRMIDQHDVDLLRRLIEFEDRISPPIDAGDVLVVEFDLLPQRAAGRLDDIVLDRVMQPIRIDDLAAIVRDRELARPNSPGRAVDVDFGDDGDAGRAALRVGDAAAGDLVAGLVLARRRPCLPARFLRRRLDDGNDRADLSRSAGGTPPDPCSAQRPLRP